MPLCIYLILSLRGKIIMSNTNCSCYVSKIHDVLARHGGTCLKSQRLGEEALRLALVKHQDCSQ